MWYWWHSEHRVNASSVVSNLHSRILSLFLYRVIQEESAVLWEMIVCVILSKKVHINMCPILDVCGVMGIY